MSPWKADISQAKTPLRFIRAVSKPYTYWAVATLILATVANSLTSLTPLIYKHIVDAITALTSGGGTYTSLCFWLCAYVGLNVTGLLAWRTVSFAGSRWTTGVRVTGRYALTSYILGHSHQYYENRFAGSVASKVQQARDGSRAIVESTAFEFWPLVVSLLIGLYLTFSTSMLLGSIFLAWLMVSVPVNTYLAKRRMKYAVRAHKLETNLRGRTVDILGNIRAVREYAQEYFESKLLRTLIGEHRQAELKNWQMGEYVIALNGAMQAVFMLSMLLFSVHLAAVGTISLGSIILILSLVTSVGQSIFFIGQRIASISEQWSEVKEALNDLLNPHEVTDVPYATNLQVAEGGLVFKNVAFIYPDGREILKEFSLTIKPGEKIGLVGRSGAGKSTLIKLLLRHYDVTGGSIRVDGQDVALQTQTSVRKEISVVPQEPMLLHRSIRENIAYGKPDATEEEVVAAAKLAHAHHFIERMSEGYQTLVGERGVKLSGGERQRVALARAILKPAKILVLDEATSALDSESESAIQQALENLMVGKTVIAVAHRLSTLRKMDRILVLDKGQVVEEGSHEELVGKGGIYADLWSHQSGGYTHEEGGYQLSPKGKQEIFDTGPDKPKERKTSAR